MVAPGEGRQDSGSKLALRRLVKDFGGATVVAGIDLDVAAGESVVLLGPSGCGKTTTLRMIAGFEQPGGGEIRLDGRIVASSGVMLPPEQRRLGMVFQNYAVWPHKTVFQNVAYGLAVAGVGGADLRRRVAEALETVKLSGLESRYPSELSGGQQQRVALARAIVTQPSMLLLDEPLSNLDAGLREEMRLELRELHDRTSMTSLYVTHDQEEALVLADRIVVMNMGRIEQIGTPEDVYYRPENRFVAGFVGVNNLFTGTIDAKDLPGRRIRITTDQGLPLWARLAADKLPHYALGAQATIAIRPERVELDAGQHPESLPARVVKSVFLGNRREVSLDIRGHRVRCQTGRPGALADGNIAVRLDPDHAWVLR